MKIGSGKAVLLLRGVSENTFTRTVKKSVPVTGFGVAQRVGRGIALLLHDRGTRRGG